MRIVPTLDFYEPSSGPNRRRVREAKVKAQHAIERVDLYMRAVEARSATGSWESGSANSLSEFAALAGLEMEIEHAKPWLGD